MISAHDLLHFVGSVPLKDSEEVFRTLARELGPYLRRVPDGETGERIKWIVFQQKMLQEHPAMELDPEAPPLPVKNWDGKIHREIALLRMKADVDPDQVTFETGYDRAAIESYGVYRRLRDSDVIPKEIRFMIALPTPMASGLMYVSAAGRERYLRAYERCLLDALARIVAELPHEDISIQFDVCQEVLMMERYFDVDPADYREAFFAQFARLAAAVPERTELGFHLCYGSPGDENLVRPKDATSVVELMNGIHAHVPRRVDFIHIPMIRIADRRFLEPLRNWRRPAGVQLYLGLLHYNDTQGNEARIQAAQEVVQPFGVAAECGFGRTDPRHLPAIFAAHRAAAKLLAPHCIPSQSARQGS